MFSSGEPLHTLTRHSWHMVNIFEMFSLTFRKVLPRIVHWPCSQSSQYNRKTGCALVDAANWSHMRILKVQLFNWTSPFLDLVHPTQKTERETRKACHFSHAIFVPQKNASAESIQIPRTQEALQDKHKVQCSRYPTRHTLTDDPAAPHYLGTFQCRTKFRC